MAIAYTSSLLRPYSPEILVSFAVAAVLSQESLGDCYARDEEQYPPPPSRACAPHAPLLVGSGWIDRSGPPARRHGACLFRYLEVGCLMRKLIVLNTLTDQEKERNKKRLWEAAELKKSHTTVP